MNVKYNSVSKYYRCLCNETKEEQTFGNEKECRSWAEKVVHTFMKPMTFTITRIQEAATQLTISEM